MRSRLILGEILEDIRRRYRHYDVDADLQDDTLDLLNSVPGIEITSVCIGHPGTQLTSQGGTNVAGFNFRVHSQNIDQVYQQVEQLRDSTTKVNVHAWGGPHGNWVVWSSEDGGWRDPSIFSDDPHKFPIKSVGVNIEHTTSATADNLSLRRQWMKSKAQQLRKMMIH